MNRTKSYIALATLFAATSCLSAQTPLHAPLPAQLLSAKSIFLSNAGTADNQYSTVVYDDLYNSIAVTKHYQIVATPAEADLTIEASLNRIPDTVTNGTSYNRIFIQVVIRDPKTQALLWVITENVAGNAFRSKTFEKILGTTVAKVVTDLANLSGATPASVSRTTTPATPSAPPCAPEEKKPKTRISQEKQ